MAVVDAVIEGRAGSVADESTVTPESEDVQPAAKSSSAISSAVEERLIRIPI